jgi:hypothetical protein
LTVRFRNVPDVCLDPLLDLNVKNNCKIFPGAVPVKFICTWLAGGSSFLPPVSVLVVLSGVSGMMNIF